MCVNGYMFESELGQYFSVKGRKPTLVEGGGIHMFISLSEVAMMMSLPVHILCNSHVVMSATQDLVLKYAIVSFNEYQISHLLTTCTCAL